MICPNCKSENSESAKFCKKCGAPLKNKVVSHENMINSMNKEKTNNNTKIIIAVLVVVVIVLAGAFLYLQFFNGNNSNMASAQNNTSSTVQTGSSQASQVSPSTPTSLNILGGSFSTGSGESDKTYARINVGTQHAGENVIVQILYSRNGNSLNNGNMVPATVHSDGYLEIASADAYHYYPDHATIKIYDSNSKLLATHSVSLSPTSGTQTF